MGRLKCTPLVCLRLLCATAAAAADRGGQDCRRPRQQQQPAEAWQQETWRQSTVAPGAGTAALDIWLQVTVDATTARSSRRLTQQPSGAAAMAGREQGTGYTIAVCRGGKGGLDAGHCFWDTNNIIVETTTSWG